MQSEGPVNDRLIRALKGQPVDRPPVWFMRQAGRYLPEYREVRSRVSFLELCRSPELALEVTLQPLDRFRLDAAIVFSDILPVLEAIGREISFEPGMGPRIHEPLRDRAGLATLVRPDVAVALPHVPATLKMFREARPDTPILGFAGSPFTLLCYLVEGQGSKDFKLTKRLLWEDPEAADQVLGLLADVVGDYLQSQIDAGAAAVQMFDTWAGVLSPPDWERWAGRYAARALARVKGAPRLYFTRDSSPFLSRLHQTGADAFGLDWRVDLAPAREILGQDTPIQGNLDPIALFAPPEEIKRRVHAICDAAGPTGHVFNLGHGVIPSTPIAGVEAMIEAVHERV
ncbi:MAG: uroporphyrinogen decarboxylase [Proteobacteria bacterium]|nr:uroporphyrinogen decarboxylase [Pseudomonadota bacterium]